MKIRLTVKLDQGAIRKLKAVSALKGRSVSSVMGEWIEGLKDEDNTGWTNGRNTGGRKRVGRRKGSYSKEGK